MLVPPPKSNSELEKLILACFFIDKNAFKIHGGKVKEEDFYEQKNQLIFRGLKLLEEKEYETDLAVLASLLESKGKLPSIGGRVYLYEIAGLLPSISSLPTYITEVKRLSKSRKEMAMAINLQQAIASENQELIIQYKQELIEIEKDFQEFKPQELTSFLPQFELDYKNPTEGILSPFPALNRATGGLKKGELVSLSGLSGAGKSLIALQFALEAVKSGFKTLYFSLEMSPNQMIPRFLSMVLNLEINRIKYKEANYDEEIKGQIYTLKERPIKFVFDMLSTQQIATIAQLEKMENGLDFIIVDYFSLLQDKGWKLETEREKDLIIRLKEIAKKMAVVVFVPTALSKDVAKRKDGRASAEDTIGSIHQTYTVDIALALMRQRTEDHGRLEITKNRSGDYCSFPIYFDQKFLLFREMEEHLEEPKEPIKDYHQNY